MRLLKGKNCYLRALEPSDIDFLYQIENDEYLWEVSDTQTPFSRHLLEDYLRHTSEDIYTAKQLRLVICSSEGLPAGFIDLYDFNPQHKRAGVGIVIVESFRSKGIGRESIELLAKYAFTYLDLHQLYAYIPEDNLRSIKLFENVGFVQTGINKDWIYHSKKFKNQLVYQRIRE